LETKQPSLHQTQGGSRLWAWEELEPGEIAVAMGLTSNAVSIRLHRAKAHLAEILSESRKVGAPAGHSHSEESKEERL
jgi:predicted DNA-binding protein (UPF0251 family)